MKYYRHEVSGYVFAFETEDDFVKYGPDGLVEMSGEEVDAHLNKNTSLNREDVEAARKIAYADPITGSDRFFAEVVRLQIMGADESEISAVRDAGVLRYQQIQEANPWP